MSDLSNATVRRGCDTLLDSYRLILRTKRREAKQGNLFNKKKVKECFF